jgi:hypothetical protein
MNWYEYLGSTVLYSIVALLPVICIFIYAVVNKNIDQKYFFVFVGSLLSYGMLVIFSIITIPMEFIWHGVVNPLICAPVQGSASICKIGFFLLDYGMLFIVIPWVICTFLVLRELLIRYWDVIVRVRHEIVR